MKSLATTFLILTIAAVSFGQLQNPGFESWTNGNPDHWLTPNITNILTLVEQTDTHQEGSLAARMFTTALVNGSFMMQTLGSTRADDNVVITLQYAGMSNNLEASISIVGYAGGDFADGWAVLFTPAGGGFTEAALDWTPQVHEFDSLLFSITIADTMARPSPKSVIIDNVRTTGLTPLMVEPEVTLPVSPALITMYPNPFNGNSTIQYRYTGEAGLLSLIDPSGRIAGVIPVNEGSGVASWSDFGIRSLPAGRYTILLQAGVQNSSIGGIYLK
jgi:hypothetical protein